MATNVKTRSGKWEVKGKRKERNMAARRHGGGESLLQTQGRAELETGTPWSIRGQLEPEP